MYFIQPCKLNFKVKLVVLKLFFFLVFPFFQEVLRKSLCYIIREWDAALFLSKFYLVFFLSIFFCFDFVTIGIIVVYLKIYSLLVRYIRPWNVRILLMMPLDPYFCIFDIHKLHLLFPNIPQPEWRMWFEKSVFQYFMICALNGRTNELVVPLELSKYRALDVVVLDFIVE